MNTDPARCNDNKMASTRRKSTETVRPPTFPFPSSSLLPALPRLTPVRPSLTSSSSSCTAQSSERNTKWEEKPEKQNCFYCSVDIRKVSHGMLLHWLTSLGGNKSCIHTQCWTSVERWTRVTSAWRLSPLIALSLRCNINKSHLTRDIRNNDITEERACKRELWAPKSKLHGDEWKLFLTKETGKCFRVLLKY